MPANRMSQCGRRQSLGGVIRSGGAAAILQELNLPSCSSFPSSTLQGVDSRELPLRGGPSRGPSRLSRSLDGGLAERTSIGGLQGSRRASKAPLGRLVEDDLPLAGQAEVPFAVREAAAKRIQRAFRIQQIGRAHV